MDATLKNLQTAAPTASTAITVDNENSILVSHAMRRGSSSPIPRCIRDRTKITSVATAHIADIVTMESFADGGPAYAGLFCNDPRATAGTGEAAGAGTGVGGATLQTFTGA